MQTDVADKMGVPTEVKRELVDKAGSWRLFTEHVEPYDGGVVVLPWKRGWARSSDLYFMLYVQVCYKSDYDGVVKQGLKKLHECTVACCAVVFLAQKRLQRCHVTTTTTTSYITTVFTHVAVS